MNESPPIAEAVRKIKKRTAVHESGHAVIAHEIGWEIDSIEMGDFGAEVVQHGATWAITQCLVPESRQYEIGGVAQALAGYVAEKVCVPDDSEGAGEFGLGTDVVDYITGLRNDEGDGHGDLAAAWGLLERNLALPNEVDDIDVYAERETAFEWAVRWSCRLVLPQRENILRVAEHAEVLGSGERLDGSDIIAMLSPVAYHELPLPPPPTSRA
jgi:hypothetical protein